MRWPNFIRETGASDIGRWTSPAIMGCLSTDHHIGLRPIRKVDKVGYCVCQGQDWALIFNICTVFNLYYWYTLIFHFLLNTEICQLCDFFLGFVLHYPNTKRSSSLFGVRKLPHSHFRIIRMNICLPELQHIQLCLYLHCFPTDHTVCSPMFVGFQHQDCR